MKKNIFLLLITLVITALLVACGGNNENTTANNNTTTTKDSVTTTTNDAVNTTTDSNGETTTTGSSNNTTSSLDSYKALALAKLDELVNPVIAKIPNAELKVSIQTYYNSEKAYINGINDLETAKGAVNKVIDDTKDFAKNTLKPLAIEKLNAIVNPLIQKITYEDLKTSVQTFYNTEMNKVSSIETLDDVSNVYEEILEDTQTFITQETEKVIIALKNKALQELDPYVTALIAKIPYDTLKTDTQTFYNTEKSKLDAVDTIEGVTPCVNEIKADLETYALTEAKKIAVSSLEEVVNAGLDKIPNEDLKTDLTTFSTQEIAKLNAVNSLEDLPTTLTTILSETRTHITELLASTVKDYLARLTAIEKTTAYDYLPEAMNPSFANNIVSANDINYNFTSFTNVSSISHIGFGEQWQMVVENINQSVTLSKVLNLVQTALSSASNAVDIYLTNSYSDEINYSFTGNNYSAVFEFKNAKMYLALNVTSSVDVAIIGTVKPTIKMEYDMLKDAKGMYLSLGDAYKVKYVITKDAYELATTYGLTILGKSGSRSSYLSITKENGVTTGHIYEYTTYEGSDMIKACADFYVENGYVSVVGNKASGMLAFDGYVNELYSTSEGRLLGYEVREEKTIAGITGRYNTLWFNLWDISGISSVKVTDKTNANKSSRSTVDVYLNGSSTLLSPTYNTKIVKTSRKYDIELRSRFYYTYDAENEKYVANEVKVPMMFIQEGDNYTSFSTDIKNDNGITASVSLNQTHLNKILSDYDTLIDIFIQNKENMSSDEIIAYLNKFE